jgi:hypothetical protein
VKKENMKTKMKGKAIIGIALAAIMLASVLVAMVPTVSTVSIGGNFNYIGAVAVTEAVLVGQNVQFDTTGPYMWTDPGNVKVQKFEDGFWYDYRGPWTGGTVYNVDWDPDLTLRATNGTTNVSLSVQDPNIPLSLKVGTKVVTTIAVGTYLRIDTGGINLFGNDRVDLEIIGSDGKITFKNGQDFSNITIAALSEFGSTNTNRQINTTGWNVGDYTFQIKTKSEYACGLSASSAVKDLSIIKGEIDISAEKTFCVELETIKLTVTGVPGDTIWVNATPSSSHVLFVGGVEDTPSAADGQDNFAHAIDENGIRTYAVGFNDTGSYTIKVTVKGGPRDGDYDTVDITVSEKGVTFDMPTTVVIGEKLTVKGTSNTGDWVQIAVDDIICNELRKLVLDENGEFEKEIDTATACSGAFAVPGSVRLKAFIDTPWAAGTDVSGYTADGSVALLMTRGDLVAELSTDSVAQGDDFTINGTAKGSKDVNILIVAPKGSSGSVISGSSGDRMINTRTDGTTENTNIYYKTTTVSTTDGTFSKKIDVGENVDTGSYLVILITPGADGKYGKSGCDKLVSDRYAAFAPYYFAAKTQEDVMAIIEDAISLSDDLIWVEYIKVVPHAYINASISKSTVPPSDSFEVYGNASPDYVEIVAISPKGGNGTGMEGLYGVSIYTVPTFIAPDAFSDSEIAKIINVSECATPTPTIGRGGGGGVPHDSDGGNFYKKIKVDRGADIGNYTILVLSPGMDGIYGDSYYSYIDSILDLDGAGPELGVIDVSNKTQEEIVAIIEDIINAADSDDFMWIGNIVVTQFVSVTRDLPEEPVSPNEFIHVTLNQSGFFLNTGIVIERLPKGFKYVSCPEYNETTNELMIEFKNETSKTYFVRAGTAEQIENAVFSGTYKTLDRGLNEITGEVGGDTTLTLATPAIEADKTSCVEFEMVKLTVTGVAGDEIKVESSPLSPHVIFKEGVDDTPIGENFHGNWFNDTIDADGVRKYAVEFNDTGTYTIKVTITDSHGAGRDGDYDTVDITVSVSTLDTGSGTYPSIFGTHNGRITPHRDINVSKIYTYSCPGTGGHTEHIKIWNNSDWNVTATWNGYTGDWHNISFNESFTLHAGVEYNYTIRTGSYPQIIHNHTHTTLDGSYINCTEFTDANGKRYNNWIPAIRLE